MTAMKERSSSDTRRPKYDRRNEERAADQKSDDMARERTASERDDYGRDRVAVRLALRLARAASRDPGTASGPRTR